MPVKSLIYMFGLIFASGSSVFINPVFGVYGYLLAYNINPLGFWWGRLVPAIFQRYALFLAASCLLGFVLHWSKLRIRRYFESQEIFFIIFIMFIMLSDIIGLSDISSDSNDIKMFKVAIIILMSSHLITDFKYYKVVIWIYIISGFISSYEIIFGGNAFFTDGRLQSGVGGSDFSEGNFLAAHYLMILPWVGIRFLGGGWKSKIFCLVTAALTANTLIIIQSRGAFLAIAFGIITAIIKADKVFRKKIILLLFVGILGFFYLTNTSFWTRMGRINTDESEMDRSAAGRIEAWRAAMLMFSDYPFGVGEGRFKKIIGEYVPEAAGRDAHNTFFRCLAELGIQGIAILLILILNAFRILSKIEKEVRESQNEEFASEINLEIFALRISLSMYLVTTMFLTHTYIEEFYWLLLFPVFLKRCWENHSLEEES
ncbi:MAG: hypothetical protein CSB21_01645 [Deltaproteobacteria bacterium]|nr:MAG: hypothetical protein CSB21_01645 [Deltaproteobacteria bacterium]